MTSEKAGKSKRPDKRADCCHLRQVCPFCWAREVRRYWLKIEPLFFPLVRNKAPTRVRQVDTGPSTEKSPSRTLGVRDGEKLSRSPYDLVYRVFTFEMPVRIVQPVKGVKARDGSGGFVPVADAVVVQDGLLSWLDSRFNGRPHPDLHRRPECRALLKAAGPIGGMLESIQYRRLPADAGGNIAWHVEVHQLILAADGDAIPKALHPHATGEPRMHVVLRKPNRRILAKWMGKTLRYPRVLLDPAVTIGRVIEHLNARRGRRLVASYGRFRARTVK